MNKLIASISTPSGILTQTTVEAARAAGATQADIAIACDAIAFATIREKRNAALAGSDKYLVPDSPLSPKQQDAWVNYRKELRDLPAKVQSDYSDPAAALDDPTLWPQAPNSK